MNLDGYVDKKDLDRRQREARAIKKDIATARGVVNRAIIQYTKRKIGARNRKQTQEQKDFLAEKYRDLELYDSTTDIQDAYGYGFFDEEEYYRLLDLWELREQANLRDGEYKDRVIEMLEVTVRRIGDEYMEQLIETDAMQRQWDKNVEETVEAQRQLKWENRRVQI
ncbi:MAG: hypothetical protein LUE23_04350 [Lachnospiraceae bacterium]|nr:hypothetical protein [Lachnospiraceae bacterium]